MNIEQERAAFKKHYRELFDLTETTDGWGQPKFAHEFVEAIWNGWKARAALQSQEYTAAIGHAGQTYLDQFKNAHALPAEFRWSELWAAMCAAANKGRTKALQSQDREGWKEAAIAWEVCASLHRDYAKGRDPLFKTRQSDFVKHAEASREKALSLCSAEGGC